ncbi:MAG: ABC transporter permease [Polyangiaceae bacterium]
MGYPLALAVRYLSSKKRAFVSVGTTFAILGVTLGVAALAIVMSVTGGFQEQFREKVLGVNAHVLVLKYSLDFREYREVMEKVRGVKGVRGVAPFLINATMVTHGDHTSTGVLLKGVDPALMGQVLDLPKYIVSGSLEGLRRPGATPPERPKMTIHDPLDDLFADAGAATDGSTRSLLQLMQRSLEEDEARADAGARDDEDTDTAPTPRRAPSQHSISASHGPSHAKPPPVHEGDVTPDGGYKSQLPEDDALPATLDPDPCKDTSLLSSLPGVVVGKTLATQLGVKVGDCLQITSPTIGISFGSTGARPPIAKQFRVIAVFEAGFDQYDSKLVYTDLYEAEPFYELGDSVTGVEMTVDDVQQAHAISKEVEHVLSNGVYRIMDWHELNRGLFTALLIQQIGMSCVLALIIIVAAFTVVATLIMVVLEKKKEIALLKALGARGDAILRVFLYQGGFIGAIGTTLGLLLGYGGCRALAAYKFPLDAKVYFISDLPVEIRPHEFIITGAFAILICLVATIFPSLYAARLRPSDGLRAE